MSKSTVALKRKRVDSLIQSYKSVKDVHLGGRTLMELGDNATILSRHDIVVNDTAAIPTPLLRDSTTPVHELDAAQRKSRTGIVGASCQIGTRVPQTMSGTVRTASVSRCSCRETEREAGSYRGARRSHLRLTGCLWMGTIAWSSGGPCMFVDDIRKCKWGMDMRRNNSGTFDIFKRFDLSHFCGVLAELSTPSSF